jgi:drug/metabolite transporter (DMT)-like permease
MFETVLEAAVAAVISIVLAPVVAWLQSLLSAKHSPEPVVGPGLASNTQATSEPDSARGRVKLGVAAAGFAIAVVAAAIWGLANAATQFSAEVFRAAVFEIGFIQFIGGSISVLLIALLAYASTRSENRLTPPALFSPWLILSSILMAINTCLFTAAVAFVNAGAIAVLENMQVVWIALILTLFLGVSIPARWFFSAAIVLCGALFVLEAIPEFSQSQEHLSPLGLAFGLGAGLTFAAFNLTWAKGRELNPTANFGARTLEMAMMLTLTTILIVPLFFAFNAVSGDQATFNPMKLPPIHIGVQFLVGALSIGVTYVLMNEAYEMLKAAGDLRVLIVGLGISYAVLFTLISEYAIFGRVVSFDQWIGVVLFSLGFMMVWRDISKYV